MGHSSWYGIHFHLLHFRFFRVVSSTLPGMMVVVLMLSRCLLLRCSHLPFRLNFCVQTIEDRLPATCQSSYIGIEIERDWWELILHPAPLFSALLILSYLLCPRVSKSKPCLTYSVPECLSFCIIFAVICTVSPYGRFWTGLFYCFIHSHASRALQLQKCEALPSSPFSLFMWLYSFVLIDSFWVGFWMEREVNLCLAILYLKLFRFFFFLNYIMCHLIVPLPT